MTISSSIWTCYLSSFDVAVNTATSNLADPSSSSLNALYSRDPRASAVQSLFVSPPLDGVADVVSSHWIAARDFVASGIRSSAATIKEKRSLLFSNQSHDNGAGTQQPDNSLTSSPSPTKSAAVTQSTQPREKITSISNSGCPLSSKKEKLATKKPSKKNKKHETDRNQYTIILAEDFIRDYNVGGRLAYDQWKAQQIAGSIAQNDSDRNSRGMEEGRPLRDSGESHHSQDGLGEMDRTEKLSHESGSTDSRLDVSGKERRRRFKNLVEEDYLLGGGIPKSHLLVDLHDLVTKMNQDKRRRTFACPTEAFKTVSKKQGTAEMGEEGGHQSGNTLYNRGKKLEGNGIDHGEVMERSSERVRLLEDLQKREYESAREVEERLRQKMKIDTSPHSCSGNAYPEIDSVTHSSNVSQSGGLPLKVGHVVACTEEDKAVLDCYRQFPGDPLKCASIVADLTKCVSRRMRRSELF
eukprot:GHVQ01004692.1.p1 GENE.GHVQ01004692.1~~GHVQ01004692.1.p1  ORF type:complete len:468 (+),score=71.48 GHVQ01004692.1:368-1771(+)